jgi:hypothetical protein
MAITDRELDQAFSDLASTCGGVRNDYFGLLYLEDEFSHRRAGPFLRWHSAETATASTDCTSTRPIG